MDSVKIRDHAVEDYWEGNWTFLRLPAIGEYIKKIEHGGDFQFSRVYRVEWVLHESQGDHPAATLGVKEETVD